MGVIDSLAKIEKLTETNLKLLKAINESFYTNQNHLSVNLGENANGDEGVYVVPSFVSLENKINTLQSNFENLVNAPMTSEAHFTFDGDSRAIEVKKYEQSPAPLVLNTPSQFYHEDNDILKDFLTPVPFLKFDVSGLPKDINTVVVRKLSALSQTTKDRFESLLGDEKSISINWGDVKKLTDDLVEDEDYSLYDSIQKLPIRKGQGSGTYVVTEIIDESIDENLDQHITVKLANNIDGYQKSLTYLDFDQTIEKRLVIGDCLVNWEGLAKFEIEELNFNTNTIKMRVCYGDYTNIYPYNTTSENEIPDVSKLRFFSDSSLFEDDQYVKVPLEEDQYIFVAIAPLNDRMNIRAAWGDGVLVNVYELTRNDATEGQDSSFEAYYATCRNIGDILNEISKVMSNTTTSHSSDELDAFMNAQPKIEPEIVKVTYINKHLDDTPTIKNIRALYAQKNSYNAALTEAQNSLNALESTLASIDFQDTTGIREQTQNQIDETTKRKNELINSLIKITDEIALTANNSIVPIEEPKYRIRGFFDFVGFVNELNAAGYTDISEGNIKGISVQYRYRNVQQEVGTAQTFIKDPDGVPGNGDEKTFIFSDWNQLYTPLRPRVRKMGGGYEPAEDTSNMNLPSFNQIDIPITQGETVDVRLKVIYDFGYPFIQMMSQWSDVVNFEFPVEFMKDVSVVSIIQENNNDIETNRFKSILTENGIISHVEDKILDQDVTYFHKPENISSGFYTAERRIIPLRDKLKTMDDEITRISDEISGNAAESLQVSIDFDESSIIISPYEEGNILLKSYNSFNGDAGTYGNYEKDQNGFINLLCNIHLTNISDHSLKIFPMFIGTDDTPINDSLKNYKFNKDEFYTSFNGERADPFKTGSAVWTSQICPDDNDPNVKIRKFKQQTVNQIITFRTQNPWDGSFYYVNTADSRWIPYATTGYLPAILDNNNELKLTGNGLLMYPYLIKENGLKLTYKETTKYMLLNKEDDIVIPIYVQYKLGAAGAGSGTTNIKRTMSFDVRTSLYNDPLTYSFTIEVTKDETVDNKLVNSLTKQFSNKKLKERKYTSIVK